jgi:acetolactate synthase-1/2/3 large subunit
MSAKSDYYTTLTNTTVAQCLLKYLELEGVNKLFGVPGGALMHILNELKVQQKKFTYYICRQETGAAYMADGFSRVTGKLGVVLVTSGPGATNALTGTMNAQNGNTAVLTISGEVPESLFGRGYLQEGVDVNLDVNAIYRNASQYSAIVTSPDNFQTLFSQAIREAMSRSPRATHISIPDDIAGQVIQSIQFPAHTENYRTVPHCADRFHTEKAFRQLIQADRPVILVGNGCRRALTDPEHPNRLRDFRELVEKFAIPVMTTPEAKALFPERHRLSLRCYGLAACPWTKHYLLKDPVNPVPYDGLLVLASSLQGLATDRWDPMLLPNGPFVQIDLDHRVIGRDFPVSLGIVAEVEAAIEDLIHIGKTITPNARLIAARNAFLQKLKRTVSPYVEEEKRKSNSAPILPQALMRCLSDMLRRYARRSHVFIDSGNCVGWALHYLQVDPPIQVHSALDMGPMGFSVGAVIGAKLGDPKKICVSITGDGAFLMHGAEVSTAADYDIGVIWIVLEDYDLAMVSQGMNHFFPDPDGWNHYYHIGKPDLKQYAESLGADAQTIQSPAQFEAAFHNALDGAKGDETEERKPKPQVIIARINRNEMPPYYHP